MASSPYTLFGCLDLHTHSTASDGSLTPAALAAQATALGLAAVALTDHDTIDGVPEFLAASRQLGLQAIPGVELSASWYGGSLHILGLFVNPDHPELAALLADVREHRQRRNLHVVDRLARMGIAITLAEVEQEANGGVVGRPHLAAVLVRKRVCASIKEAFEKWLGTNCPGYVRRYLPPPEDIIAVIHAAGGLAIMAHPFGNPRRQPPSKIRKTLKALVDFGLDGLEAYYSDHSEEQTRDSLALAAEFNLLITGGSDFHGDALPDLQLGRGRGNLRVPAALLEPLRQHAAQPSPSRSVKPGCPLGLVTTPKPHLPNPKPLNPAP